ncbi:MAG: N-acetylmuramic acid 6-phosphate etherase [Elusimicrobia bacterium]|nr:N-acetylmuramic acid 6-phosphate etherase [Elusimicrobiota bacterium]
MGAGVEYHRLSTERSNPRSRDIDRLNALQIVRRINVEDRRVAPAVGRESSRIARAAELAARALAAGGKLLLVGAGTSGRLAVLEAAECPPTFGTPPSQVRAVMAGGRTSVFRAREGAEDDPADGARQIARLARPGDVVVGIAASGVTPFVRGALREAGRRRCRTVLVTSNRRPALGAEIVISPAVGPEILSGSTRLKSGTAAKLVLNALTTAAMIRLGKVYENRLVDLRPASRKLRLRGIRIVGELAGCGPGKARAWFERCGGSVTLTVLCLRRGLEPAEGRKRLAAAAGSLRRALEVA